MLKLHRTVIEQLLSLKGDWPTVARASGVKLRTIKRIANGISPSPRADTLEKLSLGLKRVSPLLRGLRTIEQEARERRSEETAA